MRLSIAILISVALSLCYNLTIGQNKYMTLGDQSPIISGVLSKVKYEANEEQSIDVPDHLIPYLSGLLILNQKETSEIDLALKVWLEKYSELKSKILLDENKEIKSRSLELLNRGDFPGVEQLLNTQSDYKNLQSEFPNTFVTNGNGSPIIIGDYASVTYSVNTVIEYKLPESLTVNLLNQLYRQEKQITRLNNRILGREEVISRWIKQYRELKLQLQDTPSAIIQKAYVYFEAGNIGKTLDILEELNGTETEIATSRLLRAKLLMLSVDFKNMESSLNEIENCFTIGITISPSFRSYLDFGIFLSDYRGNYSKAIAPLTKALTLAKNPVEKIEVLLYLGYSYVSLQNQPLLSEKYLKEGLKTFENLPEGTVDSIQMERKVKILANLSLVKIMLKDFPGALTYSSEAINLAEALPSNFKYKVLKGDLYVIKGRVAASSNNHSLSQKSYLQGIEIFKELTERNKELIDLKLSYVYYVYAEVVFILGDTEKSIDLLQKSRSLAESYLTSQSPSVIYIIYPIYNALSYAYKRLNLKTDHLQLSKDFENLIQPLKDFDNEFYLNYLSVAKKEQGLTLFELDEKEKAFPLLMEAFGHYKNNLNISPSLFASNFSDCFLKISSIYYSQNEREKAIGFCRQALTHLSTLTKYDSINYTIFKVLAYNQLAWLYYNYEQNDSSLFYAEKGFQIVNKVVFRNPEYYYQPFLNSVNFITLSLRKSKAFDKAIEVYQDYRKTTEDLMNYNNLFKQQYLGTYIYYTKYLGDTYLQNEDYLNAEIQYVTAKSLLEEGELLKINNYKYQYGIIVEALTWYYSKREGIAKRKKHKKRFKQKKCEYALLVKNIFLQFPPNPQIQQSIFNMTSLSQGCDN